MAYMKAVALAMLLSGCFATSSDLRDLADDLRDETLTAPEIAFKLDAKAAEIDKRAEAMVDAATGITSPSGMVDIGIAALLAFTGTNLYRNKTRRRALAGVQRA